mmetsp:Transcript_5217/g.16772  ORF Transcript_5217/g.16772 Transcript_5217/m.16772 type:complete len:207 (-) Transcript_5217:201-821(-)
MSKSMPSRSATDARRSAASASAATVAADRLAGANVPGLACKLPSCHHPKYRRCGTIARSRVRLAQNASDPKGMYATFAPASHARRIDKESDAAAQRMRPTSSSAPQSADSVAYETCVGLATRRTAALVDTATFPNVFVGHPPAAASASAPTARSRSATVSQLWRPSAKSTGKSARPCSPARTHGPASDKDATIKWLAFAVQKDSAS